MLITFYQSKNSDTQDSHHLPHQAVDIARKSLRVFQSLVASSTHGYWGVRCVYNLQSNSIQYLHSSSFAFTDEKENSMILLHQFIPWFVLCVHILDVSGSGLGPGCGSSSHDGRDVDGDGDVDIKTDVALVLWLNEFTEKVTDERFELRQITTIMGALSMACKRVVLGDC